MRDQFKAPWDFLLIGMTGTVTLLMLLLSLPLSGSLAQAIPLGIILLAVYFGVYGYRIQDGELKIIRLGWSKKIPLSGIKSIEFKPNAMKSSIRKFGIGGLFSYSGIFSNRLLSTYKAYATHRKKTVVIITDEKLLVVTPDDPEEFIRCVREAMKTTDMNRTETA